MTDQTWNSSPGRSVLTRPFPPLLVMRDAAVRSNIEVMARYCADHSVGLAPHAKTSMTKYLIDLQLEAGAWGMTAASVLQVHELVDMGVPRILLANELVDQAAIDIVVDRVLSRSGSDHDFVCYVDSAEGIVLLERALEARDVSTSLGVLVEVGYPGGRTGTRSSSFALELARSVMASPTLELRGIAGYEGQLPLLGESVPPYIDDYLAEVHAVVDACAAEGLFESVPLVTAGGSLYFDHVVEQLAPKSFAYEVQIILRSGCYVTHDHGVYRETSPLDGRSRSGSRARFEPALELFASVLSRPEPGLALVNFGRRHAPTDDRMPIVLGICDEYGDVVPLLDTAVRAVNDQHAYLSVPPALELAPGALIKFGISHPCGAFDRWREIPVVDEEYRQLQLVSPRL